MRVPDDLLTDLLTRTAGGDSVALRTLYDRTAPQLFSVLVRILHRTDLAEEALQEVFVSIWRNAARFNVQRGHPMAWMIGIARYRAIDVRRSAKLEAFGQDVSDVQETLVADTADLSTQAELASDAVKLAECMHQLSKQQDRCIRLAFLEGLSHEEVAVKLTSPLGSVKSWIRRGLLALKSCLTS